MAIQNPEDLVGFLFSACCSYALFYCALITVTCITVRCIREKWSLFSLYKISMQRLRFYFMGDL